MMKNIQSVRLLIGAVIMAALATTPIYAKNVLNGGGEKEEIKAAIETQERHKDRLMAIQGVVGTGISLGSDGRPRIVIYTESSEAHDLPETLDGVTVKARVTGRFFALRTPVNASFIASCSGLTCNFDGSSSTGRRLTYQWDFGDGFTGSGKVATHTYGAAAPPSYSVTLTVTDRKGISVSSAQLIEPNDNCLITGETTIQCKQPVPTGVSVGHPNITAGTIGARVIDSSGNVYILSNNHVLADSNVAFVGDQTLQPGTVDGGIDPLDSIGTLSDWEVLNFDPSSCIVATGLNCNKIDAAIAQSSTAFLDNKTSGYGMPNSAIVSVTLGLPVQKYGRTTLLTTGEVSEINVTVDVCYEGTVTCTKEARFVNQFAITGGSFSAGGDSGALIVTQNNNNPVGLLFAGSETRTLANPIDAVLSRFAVAIDGAPANTPPTVIITSPTDGDTFASGETVTFAGSASDQGDGILTALKWESDIDGQILPGGSNFFSTLSDGTHTITASVTDSLGITGNTSVSIVVGSPSASPTVGVSSVNYATEGGKNNNRNLLVTVALVDDSGMPVGGGIVSISLENTTIAQAWTGTSTTGLDGNVTFTLRKAPSGCYTTTITDVSAGSLIWDNISPSNNFCK